MKSKKKSNSSCCWWTRSGVMNEADATESFVTNDVEVCAIASADESIASYGIIAGKPSIAAASCMAFCILPACAV